jgi:hypothetical protein
MTVSLASSPIFTVAALSYDGVIDALGTLVTSDWPMPASGTAVADRKSVQAGELAGMIQYVPLPLTEDDVAPSLGCTVSELMTVADNAAWDAAAGAVALFAQIDAIGTTQQVLFARAGTVAGAMAIEIKDLGSGMRLRGYRYDGGGTLRSIVATPPSVGVGHHFLMSWGPAGLKLYVDGTLVGSDGTTNWVSAL